MAKGNMRGLLMAAAALAAATVTDGVSKFFDYSPCSPSYKAIRHNKNRRGRRPRR